MERRRDPRTDARYSLRNLLRSRAAQHDWSAAVVATSDGHLLAAEGEAAPGLGEKLAAYLSRQWLVSRLPAGEPLVVSKRGHPFAAVASAVPVRRQAVIVGALGRGRPPRCEALREVNARVSCILDERRAS